jgi:hypothetical protein
MMDRRYKLACFAATIVLLGVALLRLYADATTTFSSLIGVDRIHYLDGVDRWWATGSPYLPNEVAARFQYEPETFLHPPIALPIFALFRPFPVLVWYAIPLGIIGWAIWRWRPAPWAWVALAALACWTDTAATLLVANSTMFVTAAVAAGLVFGWPFALIVAKPSFLVLPFAGARRRSWWIASIIMVVACIPFGGLWLDWLAVVRNSPGDATYSMSSVPDALIPVVAWLGATRHRPTFFTGRRWQHAVQRGSGTQTSARTGVELGQWDRPAR